MSEQMAFPENLIDAINGYSFRDSNEIYTNGIELIPVFRVYQILDHYYPREDGQCWGVLGENAQE